MKICIIGGGFSGASLALRLLPYVDPKQLTIIEPRRELGLGPAYGVTYPHHLLNVPADRMGIFAEEPEDFFAWTQTQTPPITLERASFAPRIVYGRYLREKLSPLIGTVRHLQCRAVDLDHHDSGAFTISCDDGTNERFDAVILALGNQAPVVPLGLRNVSEAPGFVKDPWRPDALGSLVELDAIAIIGTGLTSVDAVIELYERGFAGTCTMVSRRGLLPRSHPPTRYAPLPSVVSGTPSLRSILRTLRKESRSTPWQAVVDSIRPRSAELWQGLSTQEKLSFIRRVRPYWDVHRHRIPEQSAQALEKMQRDGRLTVVAGHLTDALYDDGQFTLGIRTKQGSVRAVVDAVINCAGPGPAVQDPNCKLIQVLCRKGLASPDDCRLGLRVDSTLRILAPDGVPYPTLFALGSMIQGTFWECIAVPELRQHARLIASALIPA